MSLSPSSPASVVSLRSRPQPRRPFVVAMVAALAWLFLGVFTQWLVTGGTGWSFTGLAGIVFLGPLTVAVVLLILGDAGPLARLWESSLHVDVAEDGITWRSIDGVRGLIAWDALGGVSTSGSGGPAVTTFYGRRGTTLLEVTGGFRRGPLAPEQVVGWEVAAIRPDLYERVGDGWSSYRGCVRRDARLG